MKKILLVFILISKLSYSQWVHQIGVTGNDVVKDCVMDKNKNLYVTGSYQGTVDFGNGHIESSNVNSVDFFAAKYDKNNNCIWTSTFPYNQKEEGERIFLDTTDNSLYSSWLIDASTGNSQFGFGKMNPNGIQSWFFYFQAGQWFPVIADVKTSNLYVELLVIPMNTNNFFIQNYDSSGIVFNTTYFNCSMLDIVLDKTDGTIISSHSFNYPNAYIRDAKFSNDSIIIGGGFLGTTQIEATTLAATNGLLDGDAFLASVDTNGNCFWAKQYSEGVIAQKEEAAGIMVNKDSVYFFKSIISSGASGGAYGFLCCYDRLNDSTRLSLASPTLLYNTNIFYPGFRGAIVKKNKMVMIFTVYDQFVAVRNSLKSYDMNSLNISTSFFTFPSGASVTTESFASDSSSLYLVGGFQGSANFGGTNLNTTPSNSNDGYIFKKNYCFYSSLSPPTISGLTTICQNDTAILDAGSGYTTYSWTGGGTGQTKNVTTSGTYACTVTSAIGCSNSASVLVTVNSLPNPVIMGDSIICAGVSTTLDAGNAYLNYLWSTTDTVQLISTSIAANYWVVVTDSNNCSNSASITVTVNTADTSVSIDGSKLTSNAIGATYQWIYCDSIIIANAINQSYTALTNGLYSVIVTQNGCSDTSRCQEILGVGMPKMYEKSNISIYPNPTNDVLNIINSKVENGVYSFAIQNVFGQILLIDKLKVTDNSIHKEFSLSMLSSGIFFLIIGNETSGSSVVKFEKR